MVEYDIIIQNGLVFDGQNNPPIHADVGIKDHLITTLSKTPLDATLADQVIDAKGHWVCPGFIDLHTHYDAELMVAPSLQESVRHGVTTCFVGSCSISLIYSEPEDASDIFTRVEAIPREYVLPCLNEMKTWNDSSGYVKFLQQHPIGPNIACHVGHSDLRTSVMGLERAVNPKEQPSVSELKKMKALLNQAIDDGFLGMSSMTNPWDKVDGDRHRSASLPSVYASWKEYRALHRVLRQRDSLLQSAPNLNTKINALFFLCTSAGLWFRNTLRTSLITLMDTKADPASYHLAAFGAAVFNKLFGADFRWQTVPLPFVTYADGMDFIVFEEFPAGEAVLHLKDHFDRVKLFKDDAYRERFKRDFRKKWGGKVWHRDFGDALIMSCPDSSLEGKHIKQVAQERGHDEADTFLDLMIDYGDKLRWRTTIGNHRPGPLRDNASNPNSLIGFSDAGAHLRNMAFYNCHLNVLKMALDGSTELTPEYAVWRISGEMANWYRIDAGHIALGKRADIAIINPEQLATADLQTYHEAPFKEMGDLPRVVNRIPGVVTHTLINGHIAFEHGKKHPDLGVKNIYGTFLRSGNA